jgi:hypothetical protein
MAALFALAILAQTTHPRPRRPELPAAMFLLAPEEMGHTCLDLDGQSGTDDTDQRDMPEAGPEQLELAPLSAFAVTAFAEAAPR